MYFTSHPPSLLPCSPLAPLSHSQLSPPSLSLSLSLPLLSPHTSKLIYVRPCQHTGWFVWVISAALFGQSYGNLHHLLHACVDYMKPQRQTMQANIMSVLMLYNYPLYCTHFEGIQCYYHPFILCALYNWSNRAGSHAMPAVATGFCGNNKDYIYTACEPFPGDSVATCATHIHIRMHMYAALQVLSRFILFIISDITAIS